MNSKNGSSREGLREGKAEAWQALYDAFAERVWRGVARLLGPQSTDVADVVQETMMAAAQSAGKFDPQRGPLWPWLWGIAHNHLALHLRKQERRDRLTRANSAASNGQLQNWLEGKEPSPPAVLASAELATLVRSRPDPLPTEYGLLLTARYLEEPVALIALRSSTETAVRSNLPRPPSVSRSVLRNERVSYHVRVMIRGSASKYAKFVYCSLQVLLRGAGTTLCRERHNEPT